MSELRQAIDDYIKVEEREGEKSLQVLDDPGVPDDIKAIRDELVLNLPELYNFHAKFDIRSFSTVHERNNWEHFSVMLKGLQYYSDDPGKV